MDNLNIIFKAKTYEGENKIISGIQIANTYSSDRSDATGTSNSKSTGIGDGFSIDLSVKSDFNFDDLDT